MDIRPKVSSLVSGQLPAFIQEDYQTFIAFLEAYYEYLESESVGEYKSLRDIDDTLDSFVQYFRHELSNFTNAPLVDERFLIQHLKEYYSSKGSEASYQFLFRILFNAEVELKYPKENILRSSDGRWNQDTSIILSQDEGDIFDIVGNGVTVTTATQSFTIFATRIKVLGNNYEVFLDKFYYGTLSIGDIITYGDFVGTVQPAATKVSIIKAGTGFNIGQTYNIDSDIGTPTLIKVTKVGSNGELLGIQIIKFGTGYTSDFYSALVSGYGTAVIDPTKHYSYTGGFIDSGRITQQTYFLDGYTEEDYTGEVLKTFYNDYSVPADGSYMDDAKTAILSLQVGSIQKYPGYYTAVNGFLSDDMYLEDNRFYQTFSYVIKVNQSIDTYRTIIKSLIHPAGLALFGEYSLTNVFDLSASVELLIRYLSLDLQEEVFTDDSEFYLLNKVFNDLITTSESDTYLLNKALTETIVTTESDTYSLSKPLTDSFTSTELYSSYVTKVLSDSITSSESISSFQSNKSLTETVTVAAETEDYFLEDYLVDPQDYANEVSVLHTFDFTKNLTDSVSISDDISVTSQYGRSFSDSVTGNDLINVSAASTISDSAATNDNILYTLINKVLSDSASISELYASSLSKGLTDSVTPSDSGSITISGYFLEDYAVDYAPLTTVITTF